MPAGNVEAQNAWYWIALAVDALGAPERLRIARERRLVEVRLDRLLELVGQLAAGAVEELDAVVVVGIVRGADDDAEVAVEALHQVGDAGRRQRPDQQHVDAGGDEAGLERGLEHVARQARVLADQDRAAVRREHARRGARRAAARTRRSSDASPTRPRTPSVPKYCLAIMISPCDSPQRRDDPQRVHRRRHVVRAHDSRALQHRKRRQRHAAAEPLAGRRARSAGRSCDLRDSPASTGSPSAASSGRRRSSSRLCSRVLPKPKPGSMTSRDAAMPAATQAATRAAQERRGPRPPRRRSAARPASCAARPACASGRPRTPSRAPPRSAPGSPQRRDVVDHVARRRRSPRA